MLMNNYGNLKQDCDNWMKINVIRLIDVCLQRNLIELSWKKKGDNNRFNGLVDMKYKIFALVKTPKKMIKSTVNEIIYCQKVLGKIKTRQNIFSKQS